MNMMVIILLAMMVVWMMSYLVWIDLFIQVESLRWQANRACGSFFSTIQKILGLLHDDSALVKLGITFPLGDEAVDGDSYWIEGERNTLHTFMTFLVHLSSYRAWSQMQFAMMLPQALACVHHESNTAREDGMVRIDTIIEAVLRTERQVYDASSTLNPRLKKKVTKLLQQMSWNALQLGRESMAICSDCGCDSANEELRLFTFLLFGRMANTKFLLEDCFNHVSDISRRHAKNHTMQRSFGQLIANNCCGFSVLRIDWEVFGWYSNLNVGIQLMQCNSLSIHLYNGNQIKTMTQILKTVICI